MVSPLIVLHQVYSCLHIMFCAGLQALIMGHIIAEHNWNVCVRMNIEINGIHHINRIVGRCWIGIKY